MRTITLDWLFELAQENKICRETVYLAFNLLDRYLSIKGANKTNLQLVAAVCMHMACKKEVIYFYFVIIIMKKIKIRKQFIPL